MFIVDSLDILVDGTGAQLQEETSERRATGAAIEPEDDGVVLGVITRLEEPFVGS